MSSQQLYSLQPRRSGAAMLRQGLVFVFGAALILWVSYRLFSNGPRSGSAPTPRLDTIPWQTDFSAALEQSKKTGKPVLADFSAEWCPPCQEMKHNAWPDPRVEQVVKSNYVPLLMDADRPESSAPGERYNVRTIPRILVLDANGNVLKQGEFMSADELLAFLR